jgi:hypothetical protein
MSRALTPGLPVLRKSRRERFKPVLVMEIGENRFRSDPISQRNMVADRSCHRQRWRLRNPGTEAGVRAASIVMKHPLGQDREMVG